MKYIKTYENVDEIKKEDYVICNCRIGVNILSKSREYINSHVGQIIAIDPMFIINML